MLLETHSNQKMYTSIYNVHLKKLGKREVRALKPVDLQRVITEKALAGLSEATLRLIKITACQIMDIAVENEFSIKNPFTKVKIPKAPKEQRKPLTEEQKNAVLKYTDHRMSVPARIMLLCGLRRGELLALTWSDVDFDQKTITVSKSLYFDDNHARIKSPKSAAGMRVVLIPDSFIPALAAARKVATSTVLAPSDSGQYMTSSAFKRAWESYMHYLNIACGGKDRSRTNPKVIAHTPFTPHQLRHTYATMLYSAGVDVLTAKELLGHEDTKTTMEIYTHLAEDKKQKSIDAFNDYLSTQIQPIDARAGKKRVS